VSEEPFIPTVSNPGRVSFSSDGTRWSLTRDEFLITPDGHEMQMVITRFAKTGSELPPAVRHVDWPA